MNNNNTELSKLNLEGTIYETQLNRKYLMRKKYVPVNPKLIHSFIPGTIKDIYITKGANVSKGDSLLTYEAMKMLNLITSPIDGIVKDIFVSTGKLVPKNFLMIEFE